MPFTAKGSKIMANMEKEYGPEKAKRVFYASRNAGKISGVEKGKKAKGGGTQSPLEYDVHDLYAPEFREDRTVTRGEDLPDISEQKQKRGGRARRAKGGKTAEKATFPGPFSEDYDELYEPSDEPTSERLKRLKKPKVDIGKVHGGRARKRADR
jgi:hypothetical protein